MTKKVLFLGYDETQTRLISCLRSMGCIVEQTGDKLRQPEEYQGYDFMVSYGYRHIISEAFICGYGKDIINLHISYLPFNRGAHPNFWAFYDGTPHGVTIHLIDKGIDTGAILYQRQVVFDAETTFTQTYGRLVEEMEQLFCENAENIVAEIYTVIPQQGEGTYHAVKDLPDIKGGWDADIQSTIKRLKER